MRKIDNFKKKKIAVAMSGGVDSSVAAALLKIKDLDVTGFFIKLWSPEVGNGAKENKCCSSESERRARKVASILNVPFYVLDLREEFRERVINYFLKQHEKGKTPNPCVVCNKKIKFGLLLEKALKLDNDFIATGHYARIEKDKDSKRLKLCRGLDKKKDQSYFLWQLKQKQLEKILFPVGEFKKREVRMMAREFGLPVKSVKGSQEICFIPGTINEFLKGKLKDEPGKIVSDKGKELGKHQGLYYYTIGQRKGIGLSGGPWYVLEKNLEDNTLVVTKKEDKLMKRGFEARDINWIRKKPKLPLDVKAKVRYGQETKRARILSQIDNMCKVEFKRKQRAITPGQSSVFYKKEELLGGGVICED